MTNYIKVTTVKKVVAVFINPSRINMDDETLMIFSGETRQSLEYDEIKEIEVSLELGIILKNEWENVPFEVTCPDLLQVINEQYNENGDSI